MRTIPFLALLVACTPNRASDGGPTGSSTVAVLDRAVYTVNAWDGTVSRLDPDSGAAARVRVPGEPTRITAVGDELWVTLRAARAIAVLRTGSGAPEEVVRIHTGAEPVGIVATADGSRVYVALSQQDEVVEYDGLTRTELRTWIVADDPRWLALHPSGQALFVAHAFDAAVERIDLEDGAIRRIEPPNPVRPLGDGTDAPLDGRATGDPSISPFGDALVLPTLFADHTTPVEQPDSTGAMPPQSSGYGASASTSSNVLSIGRLNPALVAIPLDPKDGAVVTDERVMAFFVGAVGSRSTINRGYVSSATFAPNGTTVYATLEAANAVAVVDLRHPEPSSSSGTTLEVPVSDGPALVFVPPHLGGFVERPQLMVDGLDSNPAGAAVDADGKVWIDERGGRSLSWVDNDHQQSKVEDQSGQGGLSNRVAGRFTLGEPLLDPLVEEGRELFYSATAPAMVGAGAGVSCATCHFDGRNDGVTWTFTDGVRNTPSLAGPVGQTAPVTWTSQVDSVGTEAELTALDRMGGTGLDAHQSAAIDAFVESTRDVDVADKGRDDALVALGAEVFARPEVGCAACHTGPRYTDNLTHSLFGLAAVNTPGLVGVDATAPYLHDGSAPSLRALLLMVRDGSMGSTASLSDGELDGLEAFLRSL